MRLTDHVHLVGGGGLAFGLSDELDSHVYAIDGGHELALIDAGAGRGIDAIVEHMRADGLAPQRLRYLLLTHAHADHAGGAAEVREQFGVDVLASAATGAYLSAGDEERISLAQAKRGGYYPSSYRFRACPVAGTLAEGDRVAVGELSLEVLETPGHCSGGVSFLLNDGGCRVLFTGDTVFHGGKILLTGVWDCDSQQYMASLRKLAALEVDVLLPGHLSIALSGGGGHLRRAAEALDRLAMPPNIL